MDTISRGKDRKILALMSRASITRLARFPPLAAASVRPFQEGLWSEQAEPWLDLLLELFAQRKLDPGTHYFMVPRKGEASLGRWC